MRHSTLVFIAVFATVWNLGVIQSAPVDSSEDVGDPSVDFPEDDEETSRGWAMTNTVGGDGITEGGLMTKHWNFFSRMLENCGARGFEACVGSKALSFVDGYLSQDSIPLTEGVALVKRNISEPEESATALSERTDVNGTEASGGIVEKLFERATRFLRSYSVQLKLPEADQEEVAFGLEEGRKIKKTLLPIILGIGLKVLGVLPLVFGGLALLVGKAVFISKLAFVVAALVGLSSLFSSMRSSGAGGTGSTQQRVRVPLLSQVFAPAQPAASIAAAAPQYTQAVQYPAAGVSWPTANSYGSSSSSSGSSGWSRRSADVAMPADAQEMAYAAQIPNGYYQ